METACGAWGWSKPRQPGRRRLTMLRRGALRQRVGWVMVVALAGLVLPMWSQISLAQSPDGMWSDFVNISKTATASSYPAVAVDNAGNVHVLWSEDFGGATNKWLTTNGVPVLDVRGNQLNLLTDDGNTLYYTRWDGSKWLTPVDVQIGEGVLQFTQAAVDANGILHVIWISGNNPAGLYYSNVRADKAESAQAWSTPVVLAEPVILVAYPVALVADNQGGLHALYSQLGDRPGAYVINSTDGGANWSTPVRLLGTSDSTGAQDGVATMRLQVDDKNRLHATWTRFGEDGNGKTIYYSQSHDCGRTWSEPFEVATAQPGWYEVDWLTTGVVGDQVHLIWEGGTVAALNERISQDGGLTWERSRRILPNLVGENGFANLVLDSSGLLHMLVVQRADAGTLAHGIWYTTWTGKGWQDPLLLGTHDSSLYGAAGGMDSSALLEQMRGTFTGNGLRYQQTAVVGGNQLIAVVVNEWDGDIYSTHTTLSGPAIGPRPYPTPSATATATSTTEASARATGNTAQTTAVPSPNLSLTDTPTPAPGTVSSFLVKGDGLGHGVPLGAGGTMLFVLVVAIRALAARRAKF